MEGERPRRSSEASDVFRQRAAAPVSDFIPRSQDQGFGEQQNGSLGSEQPAKRKQLAGMPIGSFGRRAGNRKNLFDQALGHHPGPSWRMSSRVTTKHRFGRLSAASISGWGTPVAVGAVF